MYTPLTFGLIPFSDIRPHCITLIFTHLVIRNIVTHHIRGHKYTQSHMTL